MKGRGFIFLLGAVFFLGCGKDTLVPPEAGAPVITFVDIQPRTVLEFKDSIDVTIHYSDPDGDLGHENPDILMMSVQDSRLQEDDWYHMPLLAPKGSKITIEGELTMKLKNTFLLGSGGDEVTSYIIKIVDRAGNESNKITTAPITITKE